MNIARDFAPIVPFIDLSRIGEVMGAEVSGIMTREEATEKRSELVQNAMWNLGGWGGVGEVASIAGPMAGRVTKTLAGKLMNRAKTVQESISTLSSTAKQKALSYLRGNARANREATTLFNRINSIAEKNPGLLSDELFSRIQASTSRVMGDIDSTNNLRFLKDYDAILAQIEKTPKGTPAYEELLGRLELRTRTLEAIYKSTDSGSFEARVYEAIREAKVPPAMTNDVARCIITSGQGGLQGSNLMWRYLFPLALASIQPDRFCDIAIAKILKEQDPQGWVSLPDGRRQRFLIEKWDCNDCGAERIPAWVHVLRANDKEDLAKVTHCPGCGNPKEASEAYYGNWTKGSRGEIRNATQDDIVRPGGRERAKKEGSSDEHYCGFCGTIIDSQSSECKSCGVGDIASMVDLRSGQGAAPHEPRAKPPDSHRSGRSEAAARDEDPRTGTGSSEVVSGKGPLIAAGGTAAVAVGAVGYYMLKGTEVEVTVSKMNWRHTSTLERNIPVSKSGWRESIPAGAFDVNSCDQRFSHTTDVACGTESYTYTIPGSCTTSSSNGITTETCSEDSTATGSRTKYCPENVYKDWCNYKINEWTYVTSATESGTAPQGQGPLPWPRLSANGSKERIVKKEDYNVEFTYEMSGKKYKQNIPISNEAEFKSWELGDRAKGTHRRATGLSHIVH